MRSRTAGRRADANQVDIRLPVAALGRLDEIAIHGSPSVAPNRWAPSKLYWSRSRVSVQAIASARGPAGAWEPRGRDLPGAWRTAPRLAPSGSVGGAARWIAEGRMRAGDRARRLATWLLLAGVAGLGAAVRGSAPRRRPRTARGSAFYERRLDVGRRPHLAHRSSAAGPRDRRSSCGSRGPVDARHGGPRPGSVPRRAPAGGDVAYVVDRNAAEASIDVTWTTAGDRCSTLARRLERRPVLRGHRRRRRLRLRASSGRAGGHRAHARRLRRRRQQRPVVPGHDRQRPRPAARRSCSTRSSPGRSTCSCGPLAVHLALVFPTPLPRRGPSSVARSRRSTPSRSVPTRWRMTRRPAGEPVGPRLGRDMAGRAARDRRPVLLLTSAVFVRTLSPDDRSGGADADPLGVRWAWSRARSVGLALFQAAGAAAGSDAACPRCWIGLIALPLPLGLAAGILRDHLFDIDVVVNRTLVYGGLTLGVVARYVAAVLGDHGRRRPRARLRRARCWRPGSPRSSPCRCATCCSGRSTG